MFGFGNYSKPGKGFYKEDLDKSGISLYFDIFSRRLRKLISLNLLYILASIPAIVISIALSLYFITILAENRGINIAENATLLIFISIFFSVLFFQVTGSGPASAAKCYVLRKYVNDTHSWVFSDFFENLKLNFKQGMIVYLINTVITAGLVFAFIFYSSVWENSLGRILTVVIIITAAIFTMMQMYIYQLLASVELRTKYIYKNALILTVAKLPWNIFTIAVIAFAVYLMYSLAMTIPLLAIFVLLVLYFSLISFTQIFMTNNIMKKYVIEPGLSLEKEDQ